MAGSGVNAFLELIEVAVEAALKRVQGRTELVPYRLIKVPEAARYLALSKREVYNMIANNELKSIKKGRARLVEVCELDRWIERSREQH